MTDLGLRNILMAFYPSGRNILMAFAVVWRSISSGEMP